MSNPFSQLQNQNPIRLFSNFVPPRELTIDARVCVDVRFSLVVDVAEHFAVYYEHDLVGGNSTPRWVARIPLPLQESILRADGFLTLLSSPLSDS